MGYPMTFFVMLILGFGIGSIPFGLIVAKLMLGIDIRKQGSGNIGMTNVMRVGGKLPGILTFLLDFAKGSVMMMIAEPWLFDSSGNGSIVQWSCVGIATVSGHIFSIFLKFKGGKGISTLFGILAILNLSIGLIAAFLWVGTFLAKQISSLAALVMLAGLPFLFLLVPWMSGENISLGQFFLFSGLSALIIFRHRENIDRLLRGEEKQLKTVRQSHS
ncbi:MAG: glycerol-3-phosphate 1-O-acyltransferase PlsY [SAR324 cluster bacterium]|nr:glycerol-3-phosphate 1-O-acyltransferase PlsY [SAR324 cluster bacterium]